MKQRADGFTIIQDMMTCGWARAGFPHMKHKAGAANCIFQYMETGEFTPKQKKFFLTPLVTGYRKYCFGKGLVPKDAPLSWGIEF